MLSFDHQNHSKWHKWCHVRYKMPWVLDQTCWFSVVHLCLFPYIDFYGHWWGNTRRIFIISMDSRDQCPELITCCSSSTDRIKNIYTWWQSLVSHLFRFYGSSLILYISWLSNTLLLGSNLWLAAGISRIIASIGVQAIIYIVGSTSIAQQKKWKDCDCLQSFSLSSLWVSHVSLHFLLTVIFLL